MSISFSGLASGLDTSSWVESLVSLREAKVEEYEAEKTNVESLQETLGNIKSFFSSFRTMIEKVTDSSFAIPSMDIFAQKLATSSDAAIVTALATTEAEEGEYDVLVDNLATNIQAVSGYKFMTTITQSATATMNSKLTDLGVKAGNIGVTVDSTEHIISITENDTISSLITKLQNAGAEASFNEKTGVFSINLDNGAINDIDNTGIIDALHLESASGYESTFLETSTSETIVTTATGDTKISELGEINAGNIIVNANDTSYTIGIDANTTLQDLIDELRANGVDAELTSDGVFTIRDAEIVDSGNTGIIEALGLESDMNSKTQTADDLQYETIVTTVTQATGETKLNELTAWDSVGSNPELVIKDSSGKTTTVAVNGDMTLDDVISSINNAGLTASLGSNGVLTISGGEVSGSAADALGISAASGSVGYVNATGNVLYTESVSYATGSDSLADLGINSSGGIDIYNSKNVSVGHIATSDGMTLDEIFAELQNYGISGSINQGRITLTSSNGNIIKGSVAEDLGIETEYEVTTANTSTSSALKYTITQTVDGTTTLGELGIGDKEFEFYLKDSDSSWVYKTQYAGDVTLDDAFQMMKVTAQEKGYDFDISINNGVITIESDDLYIKGEGAEALGIGVTSSSTGVTTPQNVTSTAPLTYTTGTIATEDSLISVFITLGSGTQNRIKLYDIRGDESYYTVTGSTTFDDLLGAFANVGISASMSDGVISFTSSNGTYAEDYASNGILSKLGIKASLISSTTVTTGMTQTSSSPVYVGSSGVITEDSLISNAISLSSSNNKLVVYTANGSSFATITISSTMTFGDLKDELSNYGIDMTVNSEGSMALTSSGGLYVQGGFADAVGWDLDYEVHYSGLTMNSSSRLTYTMTITETATFGTKLGDIIDFGDSSTLELLIWEPAISGGTNIQYFSPEDSLNDIQQRLSEKGITMTINNGVISLDNGGNGNYVTGELATKLGIRVADYYDAFVGITQTVSTSYKVAATMDSKISDYIDNWDSISHAIYVKSASGNVLCTYTVSNTDTFDLVFNLSYTGVNDESFKYGYSFSASMTDGVLKTTNTPWNYEGYSKSEAYLEGDIIDAFGIGVTTTSRTVTITVGTTATGDMLFAKANTGAAPTQALGTTKLTEIMNTANTKILEVGDTILLLGRENDSGISGAFTVTSTSTVNNFLNFVESNFGVKASITNGKVTFKGDSSHCLSSSYVASAAGTVKGTGFRYFGFDGSTDFYTEETVNVKENTASKKLEVYKPITLDTKMSELGFSLGTKTLFNYLTYAGSGGAQSVKINIDSETTVQTMLSSISNQLNGKFAYQLTNNGQLTITPSTDIIIVSMEENFRDIFNLEYGEGKTYRIVEFGKNTNSSYLEASSKQTVTATSATTLGQLGLTSNGVIRGQQIPSSGPTQSFLLTFKPTDTIGDLQSQLQSKGLSVSLSNGNLGISGTSSAVVTSIDSNLEDILNMQSGEGYSYEYNTIYLNTTSDELSASTSGYITEDTKLVDLGFTLGEKDICHLQANDSAYGETTISFTIENTSTVGDLLNQLNNSVLDFAAQLSYGRLSIIPRMMGPTGDHVIEFDEEFADIFNLTAGEGYTYTTSVENVYGNTNSNKLTSGTTYTANMNTTLGELGLSGEGEITFVTDFGEKQSITVTSSSTIQDLELLLFQKDGNYSVTIDSTGVLNIRPLTNGYITDMSSNLLDVLKLQGAGNGYTYTTSGKTTYENTPTDTLKITTTVAAGANTTLGQVGITGGKIQIYQTSPELVSVNIGEITVAADDTISDFLAKLEQYGIQSSIGADGSLHLESDFEFYLKSDDSNLPDILNLNSQTDFTTVWSNKTTGSLSSTTKVAASDGTTLENLEYADGTGINFDASGNASLTLKTVTNEGIVQNITLNFSKTQSLGSVISALAGYGIQASVDGAGRFNISSNSLADFDVSGTLGSFLMGAYNKTYNVSNNLNSTEVTTAIAGATRDTLLSDLGVTAGEYYIYNNGVKYTALISSDETLGSFLDTLESFGIQTGLITDGDSSKLVLIGQGNSYIAKSNSISNASNVVEKLFGTTSPTEKYNYTGTEQISTTIIHKETATLDTLLSEFDTPWGNDYLRSEGVLSVTVDGEDKIINITADETFGSLVDKLNAAGVNAAFFNGKLYINDSNATINTSGTTSSIINPNSNIYLTYKDDMDGYMASSTEVVETTTIIEEKSASAASFATLDTKMGNLNISEGTLTVYRDGEKAVFNIDPEKTFRDLRSEIAAKFSDVDLNLANGVLLFNSKTEGVNIEVGATTDTSNLQAVTGLTKNEETGRVESARALYNVNVDSVVTDSGLFRRGQVTEGTFIVGNQEITIGSTTTLADIISQINSSEESNATAYWDSIDGKLVIKSRTTGSALINIEAGTSNFTDIMGYTSTERKNDGSVDVTRMNVDTQTIGKNARFSINGTTYTSSSNTVTSDISRIKGLTLELKDLTEGAPVTITVERDKETVANALSDVVDSYNELMKNLDEALAVDGNLHSESTLKLIRNQLRNLMTSSDMGTTVFRNLDAIGISVDSASANNISTSNESIIDLTFDKDKFLEAYEADADAVKALLVGGDNNKGIFTQVETLLENALQSVTGYFAITEESYQRQITKWNDKITKENASIEKYRARLEKKFSSMDLLIAQMQQQYSSFLTT